MQKYPLDRKRFTTIVVLKTNHKELKLLKRKLKYESIYAMLAELTNAISHANYSRFDLECLLKFGRIPDIISGEARNEREMLEKIGIRPDMKKTGEIPNVEKVGELSKDLLGKKEGEEPA